MNNELDINTRRKMNTSAKEVFNIEFWICVFLIICIFGIGFMAGSIAHDSLNHPNMNMELK